MKIKINCGGFEEEDEKMWLCACGTEAIGVTESNWTGKKEIWMSIWAKGFGKYKFKYSDRICAIWHIIRYGHPYLDQVVLTTEQAEDLGLHLCSIARREKKDEDQE